MAGDRHGEGICSARLSDRPDRIRLPDPFRDLAVAHPAPGWDLPQGLLDFHLKRRTTDVEREVEAGCGIRDEAHDLADQFLEPRIRAD